jgi:hypothetical protein
MTTISNTRLFQILIALVAMLSMVLASGAGSQWF